MDLPVHYTSTTRRGTSQGQTGVCVLPSVVSLVPRPTLPDRMNTQFKKHLFLAMLSVYGTLAPQTEIKLGTHYI